MRSAGLILRVRPSKLHSKRPRAFRSATFFLVNMRNLATRAGGLSCLGWTESCVDTRVMTAQQAFEDAPALMEGILGPLELVDVLQFVASSSLPVSHVMVSSASGMEGSLILARGACLQARFGHLHGREAALAVLTHPMTRFVVREVTEQRLLGTPISLTEILLELARLEDEMERRKDNVPELMHRLTIVGHADPSDPLECSAPTVARALASPRTRAALEAELPLAPIRVCLALAWLREQGRLSLRASAMMPRVVLPTANAIEAALVRQRGALRVLVVCPQATIERIDPAVRHFAALMGAPTPPHARAAGGPSFVRVRPSSGGVVSFTFLPSSRANRVFFDSFVRSTDALLLGAGEDVFAWQSSIPATVQHTQLPIATTTDECLHESLVRALGQPPGGRQQENLR